VIGGGFLFRQLARELVGLIPIAGVAPKVAVAYAGTWAIGRAVGMWAGDPTLRLGGQAHVRNGAPSAQGEVDGRRAAGLAVGGPGLLSTRLEPDGGPRRQLGVETGVRWAWRPAASSRSR
jgi:hypothetical protein